MVRLLFFFVLLLTVLPAHAAVLCAGDGEPPPRAIAPSGLLSAAALPYAGLDAGAPLFPISVRLSLCGRLRLRRGELVYSLGYEPYAAAEAAQPDAAAWGRVLAAEAGYTLFSWLTLSGGVRKVAFSYGHDEPEQSLALPVRPFLTSALSPDRRLGLTLDDNWGPVRVIAGLYESARSFAEFPRSGLLVTARGVMEPFGPVGRSLSTITDDPFWRGRLRLAFNISGLLFYTPQPGVPLGYALGGDVPIKFGPLGLVVEYLYGKGTPSETGAVGRPMDRQGLWAQATLMLLRPYAEVSGRYEWLDTTDDDRQRFHALTAGLTGYLYRDQVKLQAAYGHRFHYAGPAVRDDFLLLLMQIAE